MTGQGCSYGLAWEGLGPPTGEPGPANQNEFFLSKGLYYRQKYSSSPSSVSLRWRSRIWRSWAGMVTSGLRLWGWLDVQPNSLKWCWRQLMVEKWTFNSLATALVDILAVSMLITYPLKNWDICGIVLCNKTAHFKVTFYCPQHKVHLCNDHAVGGWIILAKDKCLLMGMKTNLCTTLERNKLFMHMENVWDF